MSDVLISSAQIAITELAYLCIEAQLQYSRFQMPAFRNSVISKVFALTIAGAQPASQSIEDHALLRYKSEPETRIHPIIMNNAGSIVLL